MAVTRGKEKGFAIGYYHLQVQGQMRYSEWGMKRSDPVSCSSSSSGYSESGSGYSEASSGACSDPSFQSDTSGFSDGPEIKLPAVEKIQIEYAFRALGTQVIVCSTLANLYRRGAETEWNLEHTGVPVVILDTGVGRRPRGITLIIAERGSALALFRDTIDNLSAYRASSGWHTMCLSKDHTIQIGLSFSSIESAADFWNHIEALTSDPGNISLSIPGRKKPKPKPAHKNLPSKAQISSPCCFQHVTSVTQTDVGQSASLRKFLPPKPPSEEKPE